MFNLMLTFKAKSITTSIVELTLPFGVARLSDAIVLLLLSTKLTPICASGSTLLLDVEALGGLMAQGSIFQHQYQNRLHLN